MGSCGSIKQQKSVSCDTDIVSEMETDTIWMDDEPKSQIAYDFNIDLIKEYLIYGFAKETKLNIPFHIMQTIIPYCDDRLTCLFINIFDTDRVLRIIVNPTCPILIIKNIILDKTGIPIKQQILQTKHLLFEKPLHDKVPLNEYNLNPVQEHLCLRQSYFD